MLRFAVVVVLALGSIARADQWVSPTERTLVSPNQKLQVVLKPSTNGKTGATAAIGPTGGAATKKLTLAAKWMPVDAVLFDDGTLLTLDDWHSLGHGKVATLYERDGKIRYTKTLEQLVGKPFLESVSISVSSIWWRRMPLEWSLANDGKTILITLIDENRLQLTIQDGSAALVAIDRLPDDPQRLLNRARALAKQDGAEATAMTVLDRILVKDADQFEAISLYVEILQRTQDHARVIALLDRVSPRWKTKDGYNIANVCVAWARSLLALSRKAEAERVLRVATAAAPEYTNPAIALATFLVDEKRPKDADVFLDAFVARLMKAPYLDTYGLGDIAEFYKQRKEHQKALALYLKSYKPDQVTNQFLYASLATLHEEMGNDREAIRVNEQLLAYFQKNGSAFESYVKSTRNELARLRAKKRP